MSQIVRFSVSLEDDLLEQFDRFCAAQHFATRSEAVRQLIREKLTVDAWQGDCHDAAGTLTLVYDHHRPQLRDHLMNLQHEHNELVVSTLHAHLTHDVCLEVIVLRGPATQLAEIAARLRGLKGIFKGELVMASSQAALPGGLSADAAASSGHAHPHAPGHGHAHEHAGPAHRTAQRPAKEKSARSRKTNGPSSRGPRPRNTRP